MSIRSLLSVAVLLILLASMAGAQVTDGGAPLLDSGDVPGFHLHQIYQVRCNLGGMQEQWPGVDWAQGFPGLTGRVVVSERWRTVTKEEYTRYLRQHARPPASANTIFIDRENLPNPAQAANFAHLLVRGRPEANLPGVGQCWVSERRKPGRYGFDVVFAQGTTVVLVQSQGPSWDRAQAESLVRAVVTRLRQGRGGNNGVGNGPDPQPPGNPPVNDPPGSGPGNPGNQGGAKKRGGK